MSSFSIDYTTDYRLINKMVEGVMTTDLRGNILATNPALDRLFGYEHSELIGQNVSCLMEMQKAQAHQGYIDNFMQTGQSQIVGAGRQLQGMKKSGEMIDLYISVTEIATSDGEKRFMAFLYDRTIERQQEKRLRDTMHYNRMLIENITVGCTLCSLDGKYVDVNPAFASMLGYSKEDVLELTFWELTPKSLEDVEHDRLEELAMTGQFGPYEKEYIHRAGHIVPVMIRGIIITLNDDDLILSTVEDVTHIRRNAEHLRKAKEQAERANKAKSEFLSAMSHELRTPLNAIIGFSQLMGFSRTNPLSEKQRAQIDQIQKAGEHLLELVDEVLDLSRIESGKLSLNVEPIDLSGVVEECSSMTECSQSDHDIIVHNSLAEKTVMVNADWLRTKQAILNVLSNAIKYNKPGGQVWITATQHENGVQRLNIRDNGQGIAENQKDEVFKAFHRLGQEDSAIEGNGIGLVLTRRLMEEMGGSIGFDSAQGEGTTFWLDFQIPATSQLDPPEAMSPRDLSINFDKTNK